MGGQQQDQDQQLQEEEFRFPDEELSPEEEARLRGEVTDDGLDDDVEDDDDLNLEVLEKIAGDEGSPVVPHARFHESNEARKAAEAAAQAERERADALEAQLQQLQGGAQQQQDQPPDDRPSIADLEQQALDAVLEGETERAVQLRMEINNRLKEEARAEALAEQRAQEATRAAQQAAAEFDKVVDSLEAQYPALNINNKDADLIAIDAVNAAMQREIAAGKSPTEALQYAVQAVAERFGYAPAKQQAQRQGARSPQAVAARNAAAASQQPPPMTAGMGDRAFSGQRKSVNEMDDKEFENMDPEYERKLRGEA